MPNPIPETRLAADLNAIIDAARPEQAHNVNGIPQWTHTEDTGVVVSKNKNKTTVVKKYAEDSYDGPRTSDFVDRGRSIYEAAKKLLDDEPNIPLDSPLRRELSRELSEAWNKARSDLNAKCALDENIMRYRNEASREHFEEKYKNAVEILRSFRTNVVSILQKEPNFQDKPFEGEKDYLREKEKQLITENGRPNIVNLIQLDNNSQLISAQFTLGKTTIPSSITNQGLRNFVKSAVGIHKNGKTEIHDQDYRFGGGVSSIGIKENDERHEKNRENVKELLQTITEDKLNDGHTFADDPDLGSESKPLILNVFSLTLLTPLDEDTENKIAVAKKALASIKEIPDVPSERVMMNDTQRAFAEYNSDSKPVRLRIATKDGNYKDVFVKPEFNHVNIPTNITQKKIGPLTFNPHNVVDKNQTAINNKGFSEYFSKIEILLKDFSDSPFANNELTTKNKKIDIMNPSSTITVDLITKQLNQYTYKLNSRLKEANNLPDGPDKYEKIMAIRKEVFKQNQKMLERLNTDIQDLLYDNKSTFPRTDEDKALKKQLLAAQCYINNQKLYFNDKIEENYKTKENAFVLLANMHLSLFTANITHTSGCKSAKDRTGLLNIYKEAMVVFSEKYGFYPDPLNHGQAKQLQIIIDDILYKTASVENAVRNDPGAHGLQITLTPGVFNPSKQMGLLAKAPFKQAKPTEEKSLLSKVSSKLSALFDKDEQQNSLNEISDMVKKLNSPADSNKLRQLIGFNQDYLEHATGELEKEMARVMKETLARGKAFPQTGSAIQNVALQEKQVMLKSLIALNRLKKNNPYESLTQLIDVEFENTSQNKNPSKIYEITQLITCLNKNDQLHDIGMRLDSLSKENPNTYDYCNSILVLQQLKKGILSEKLANYQGQLNTLTNPNTTRDDEHSLLTKTRLESRRITLVLATLESNKKDTSVDDYIAQIRAYKNELDKITQDIINRKGERETFGQQATRDKRAGAIWHPSRQSPTAARNEGSSTSQVTSSSTISAPSSNNSSLAQRGWSPARSPSGSPLRRNSNRDVGQVSNISTPLPPPPGAAQVATLNGITDLPSPPSSAQVNSPREKTTGLPPPPVLSSSPTSKLASSPLARIQNSPPPQLRAARFMEPRKIDSPTIPSPRSRSP